MGVFFSVVRWFHVCVPYQEQPNYYYPARLMLTAFFMLPVLTFPYALDPSDADAWLLMKGFFPLTHMYVCAVLIFNYFGTVKSWNKWKRWARLMAVPIILLLLVLFLNAVLKGYSLSGAKQQVLFWAIIVVGACASIFCLYSIKVLVSWLHQFKESDYLSNPEDFPTVYAKKVVIVPIVEFFLVWGIFFFDSKKAMIVLNVIYTVMGIVFLLSVLHTQRKRSPSSWLDVEEETTTGNDAPLADIVETPDGNETPSIEQSTSGLSEEKVSVIVGEIKAFVEGEKQFLNPHLSIVEVAEHCGYGRTYVSKVLSNEFGGFFRYVNSLRLEYAKKYRDEHPYATQDEVATASGFSSRQTFYTVRRRMG
ncbi:MAG: hypothetical protein IKX36_00055 [Prevotella sp.]|nr:hypothetical protein [Prevotella sp.]